MGEQSRLVQIERKHALAIEEACELVELFGARPPASRHALLRRPGDHLAHGEQRLDTRLAADTPPNAPEKAL